MADRKHKNKGTSLAKGPAALLGLLSLAWGILHFIAGGDEARSFQDINPMNGLAEGGSFLGFEGNGWTNLLWVAAGALLLFGSPLHWGAKMMSIIVGLALGAASVISLVDGDDVFGIFAANGPTKLLLGIAASVLLLTALLPRVGKDKHRDRDLDVDTRRPVRAERPVEHERPVERERIVERPVERERETRIVEEPDRTARMDDARPAHVVDRQVVDVDDRDSLDERPVGRDRDPVDERTVGETDRGRFTREERITERITPGDRRDERL